MVKRVRKYGKGHRMRFNLRQLEGSRNNEKG